VAALDRRAGAQARGIGRHLVLTGGAPKVNYADAALTALEQGAKPDPASTRPYGCSVKY
jgi:hypothetical protein